jgi:hypothetical protein
MMAGSHLANFPQISNTVYSPPPPIHTLENINIGTELTENISKSHRVTLSPFLTITLEPLSHLSKVIGIWIPCHLLKTWVRSFSRPEKLWLKIHTGSSGTVYSYWVEKARLFPNWSSFSRQMPSPYVFNFRGFSLKSGRRGGGLGHTGLQFK